MPKTLVYLLILGLIAVVAYHNKPPTQVITATKGSSRFVFSTFISYSQENAQIGIGDFNCLGGSTPPWRPLGKLLLLQRLLGAKYVENFCENEVLIQRRKFK